MRKKKPLNLNEQLSRMKRLIEFDEKEHSHDILSEQNFKTILKEDNVTGNLSVTQKVEFKPGIYSVNQEDQITGKPVTQALDEGELLKIKNFLKKNPEGYVVKIVIESGESRIPNTDNEMGRKRVQPGYLSEKRMGTIEKYLTGVLKQWQKEGILKGDFKIEKKKPVIGKTPWVGQEFCPKDKLKSDDPEGYNCSPVFYNNINKYKTLKDQYTSEQYLKVMMGVEKFQTKEIPVKENPEQCVAGLKIEIKYAKHNCNNAEYFLAANNTLLLNSEGGMTTNGSNAKTKKDLHGVELGPEVLNPGYGKLGTTKYGFDGNLGEERYDSFVITEKQAKQIMGAADAKNNIYLWLLCIEQNCHDDRVSVKVYSKDKVIFEGSPTTSNSLLLKFNACAGTAIEGGKTSLEQTPPDSSGWVSKLMEYKKGIYSKLDTKIKASPDIKNEKLKQIEWLSKKIDQLKDKTLEHFDDLDAYRKANNTETYTKQLATSSEINRITSSLNKNLAATQLTFNTEGTLKNKTFRTNELYGDVRDEMKTIINNLKIFYKEEELPLLKRKRRSAKKNNALRELIKSNYISPEQQSTQLMAKK